MIKIAQLLKYIPINKPTSNSSISSTPKINIFILQVHHEIISNPIPSTKKKDPEAAQLKTTETISFRSDNSMKVVANIWRFLIGCLGAPAAKFEQAGASRSDQESGVLQNIRSCQPLDLSDKIKRLEKMVILTEVSTSTNDSSESDHVKAVLPNIPADYSMWIDQQSGSSRGKSNWQNGNPLGKLAGHIYRFIRPADQKREPDVAQLLLSQMKDFFCLLGELIHLR